MPDRLERIEMLYSLRRYAEAEKLAREQIAETPYNAHAYAQLAMCLSPIDGPNYDRAIDAAKASLKYDASQSFTHYIHGWLLRRARRVRDAEESLREALRQSPFYVNARVELANLELDRNNNAEARELVRIGLNDFPNDADLLELKARIELGDNRNDQAEETVRSAMGQHPTDARFHYLLAIKQERDGQELRFEARRKAYRRANDSIREALRLDPTNPVYHENDTRIRQGLSWWQSVSQSLSVREKHSNSWAAFFVICLVLSLIVRSAAFVQRKNDPPPNFSKPRMAPADWEQKWKNDADRQRAEDLLKLMEKNKDVTRPRPGKP
jgi:predicted Zn-dependent protease